MLRSFAAHPVNQLSFTFSLNDVLLCMAKLLTSITSPSGGFQVLFGADCLANCYKFDNGVFSLSFSGDKTFAKAMNASESPKRPETMSVGALTHIRFK